MRIPLKILIFLTIAATLVAAAFPEVQTLLALSWSGIHHFYFWQFFTHVFIEPVPLSIGLLIQLGFNMYILWMFGASLIERIQMKSFFLLYFGSTLAAGLASLIFPDGILAGSSSGVYALLIAWIMFNPGSQLLLFFSFPFKAEWLVVALLGFTLFMNITAGNLEEAAALVATVLFAYLFTLIAWRQRSPFPFFYPFERRILRFLEKEKARPSGHSKIYDIKSGAPILKDEQFLDAMLDKISLHGENSLTPEEKKRMKEISERKK